MLSDIDIIQNIKSKDIVINNYDKCCFTGVGYDLRLGDYGYSFMTKKKFEIAQDKGIMLRAHESIVVMTMEEIKLSDKIAGTVHSQVKRMHHGLQAISTTIDPEWEGQLLIHITNNLNVPVWLLHGETICTVCFHLLETPTSTRCIEPHLKKMELCMLDRIAMDHQLKMKMSASYILKSKIALFIYAILLNVLILMASMLLFKADQNTMAIIIPTLSLISIFLVEVIKR